MRKCELELEPYAVPRMNVVSAIVERGFNVSGRVDGDFDEESGEYTDDWTDGDDAEW